MSEERGGREGLEGGCSGIGGGAARRKGRGDSSGSAPLPKRETTALPAEGAPFVLSQAGGETLSACPPVVLPQTERLLPLSVASSFGLASCTCSSSLLPVLRRGGGRAQGASWRGQNAKCCRRPSSCATLS